jgi:predicted RNA-binding Zn-ribbon protein involved in translation (DUF1610 family)
MTHTPALKALLERRLAQEDLPSNASIAVAELHKRLVPYALCREALGLATKAEYDVALLRLLDDATVRIEERALREAVRRELGSPEPGLAILQRFSASEVSLAHASSGAPAKPEPTAPAGPAPSSYETDRRDQDRVPGLDDLELLPEQAGAPPARSKDPVRRSNCVACGDDLPAREGLRFCPACGADQHRWPCPRCGHEVERGWKFCAMCGAPQQG